MNQPKWHVPVHSFGHRPFHSVERSAGSIDADNDRLVDDTGHRISLVRRPRGIHGCTVTPRCTTG
jgi:hypothetical protein